ncbi:Uma2 family endonuclease [Streptomyces sp. NPDC096040]|uniref:Uma2 family endonuclease n=1 Tax=Streptomyces sp. NPDC096040 TaxID=3155541 RepID=UPI00332C8488
MTLTAVADEIMERLPGWRAEVIHGQLLISPLRDASHACALTDLLVRFAAVGLHGTDTDVLQNVGLRLPTGADDYAIPDLVIVDADIDDHLVENNCCAPACFRLVLEVTSSYRTTDLHIKASAYAAATIPVYVTVDREQRRLHVLTAPVGGVYTDHRVHATDEIVTLPDSIGAKVTLDVDQILKAGQRKVS